MTGRSSAAIRFPVRHVSQKSRSSPVSNVLSSSLAATATVVIPPSASTTVNTRPGVDSGFFSP